MFEGFEIKVCLLILAGGKSKRMGFSKAFLLKSGTPFILHHIRNFQFCTKIYVITGVYHDVIKNFFELEGVSGVNVIFNENHEKGQFSSIQKGIEAIRNSGVSCDAALILPVDVPPMDGVFFEKIVKKFRKKSGKSILVATYKQKPGHPVILKSSLFNEVLVFEKTLRDFIKEHEHEVIFYDIGRREVLMNINTKDDYDRYLNFLKEGRDE